MERKLAAILPADVKGYSRLMGKDEEATIHTLTAYREVMTTLIWRSGTRCRRKIRRSLSKHERVHRRRLP